MRPWLLHQAWPWGSGQQAVEGRIPSIWLGQAVLCVCCMSWQNLAPHLAVGGYSSPRAQPCCRRGQGWLGRAMCQQPLTTALAPIWALAVLTQLRAESGTQEAWVTSETDTCPGRCYPCCSPHVHGMASPAASTTAEDRAPGPLYPPAAVSPSAPSWVLPTSPPWGRGPC